MWLPSQGRGAGEECGYLQNIVRYAKCEKRAKCEKPANHVVVSEIGPEEGCTRSFQLHSVKKVHSEYY